MTDTEIIHEARVRAFRAIDETCPVVADICDSVEECNHEDAASELGCIHHELENQLGELYDIMSRLEEATPSTARELPSEILSRVTGPFREALIDAYEQCVVVEAKQSELQEHVAVVSRNYDESEKCLRLARFVIRHALAVRRILAS